MSKSSMFNKSTIQHSSRYWKFYNKIGGFDKYGLVVNGYSIVLIELKLVIKFINQKKRYCINVVFFTTLKESCIGKKYYDIKYLDKTQMTNELQVQLLELMKSLSKKIIIITIRSKYDDI